MPQMVSCVLWILAAFTLCAMTRARAAPHEGVPCAVAQALAVAVVEEEEEVEEVVVVVEVAEEEVVEISWGYRRSEPLPAPEVPKSAAAGTMPAACRR